MIQPAPRTPTTPLTSKVPHPVNDLWAFHLFRAEVPAELLMELEGQVFAWQQRTDGGFEVVARAKNDEELFDKLEGLGLEVWEVILDGSPEPPEFDELTESP
jgi:hypothetical protein